MRFVRGIALALGSSVLLAVPAAAQRGQKPPPPVRPRAALMREINLRLMNQAQNRLALTPAQMPRFQRVVAGYAQKRSALELEDQRTQSALREQLRLGEAGNQDSVSRLLTSLNATRASHAATFSDEMRDLEPVLSPMQRAQWQVMRDRFLQQVRAAMQQRPAGAPDPEP